MRKNICPNCLSAISYEEMESGKCRCGYVIKSVDDLLTEEQANKSSNEEQDLSYLEICSDIHSIKTDIHFIANFIKVCIFIDVFALIIYWMIAFS